MVVSGPRSLSGGRSVRYDERRQTRPSSLAYAPTWNDPGADAVLCAIHTGASADGRSIEMFVSGLLASSSRIAGFVKDELRGISEADRALALQVLGWHSQLVKGASGDPIFLKARVRAFLKPLRDRRLVRSKVVELHLPLASLGPKSFTLWLAKQPTKERLRDIFPSARITGGLAQWPLGWLKKRGVICYERASGRVDSERGGVPDAAFMVGLVKTDVLPTAVANASDHYVLLSPGKDPRFLTVEEVSRGFGLCSGSPLAKTLARDDILTKNQAVSCLGRSVHVIVAQLLVAMLFARGVLSKGLTYGTIYSGIDTFAAGVDLVAGGDWKYVYASERDETVRNALLAAWCVRGLTSDKCSLDARGEQAAEMPYVDLLVVTSLCGPYSKRNHERNTPDQHQSLRDLWKSLECARRTRPRVIIVENVSDSSAVGPVTGLLCRLEGYALERGVLDPMRLAGWPMSRERCFWVLIRK